MTNIVTGNKSWSITKTANPEVVFYYCHYSIILFFKIKKSYKML